jgi:hypothetical protein
VTRVAVARGVGSKQRSSPLHHLHTAVKSQVLPTPPQIRTADRSDAPAVAQLVNAAFRSERFFIDTDRTNPDKVTALMEKGKFLMCFDDGRVRWMRLCGSPRRAGLFRITRGRSGAAAFGNRHHSDCGGRRAVPFCRVPLDGSYVRQCAAGTSRILSPSRIHRAWHSAVSGRSDSENTGAFGADVETTVGCSGVFSFSHINSSLVESVTGR